MAEYHSVSSFRYKAVSITRVAQVTWNPMTGDINPLEDASGAIVSMPTANAAYDGTVSFLDQAEAAKFANKHEADGTITFTVQDAIDAPDDVTATVVVTGPVRGFNHTLAGSGPYVVDFTADTIGI